MDAVLLACDVTYMDIVGQLVTIAILIPIAMFVVDRLAKDL